MTLRALLVTLALGAALAACSDAGSTDKPDAAAAKQGGGSTLNSAMQRGMPYPGSLRRGAQ